MNFKEWLLENDNRTGAKLGLYPSLADTVGQYPPLYVSALSADFITYSNMVVGKYRKFQGKEGFVDPEQLKGIGHEEALLKTGKEHYKAPWE